LADVHYAYVNYRGWLRAAGREPQIRVRSQPEARSSKPWSLFGCRQRNPCRLVPSEDPERRADFGPPFRMGLLFMYALYSALLAFFLVLTLPYWLLQMLRHGKYRTGLRQRFGAIPPAVAERRQKPAARRFGAENVFYFPLDFAFAVRPYLDALRPELVVVAETEFWPNFLRLAKRSGARIAVINCRISDRSLPGYKRLRFWL